MTRRHLCHALGCTTPVPPRLFMCIVHWFSLPKPMRDAVWVVYVPGQEERMDPTPEYLEVTQRAIDFLAERDGLT